MTPRLEMLIEKARHHRMSPEELREQAIRFACHNAHFENPWITREMVDRAEAELGPEFLREEHEAYLSAFDRAASPGCVSNWPSECREKATLT